MAMHVECRTEIGSLDPSAWDALLGRRQPFLRHAFLAALERHGVIGEGTDWALRLLCLVDRAGRLRGALPAFLKGASFGEFVFDWDWAAASHQAGLAYYPKMVIAVPYTPVTGPRLLLAPDIDRGAGVTLIEGALTQVRAEAASSLHCLFPAAEDLATLETLPLVRRDGVQFHWRNRGYASFEDFLSALSSRYRKEIRRERRSVQGQGIGSEILSGAEASPALWDAVHRFYASTFLRKGNVPPLPAAFFHDIGRTLGDQIVLIVARRGGDILGAAFFYRDADRLYGRHWGADDQFPNLHFELCYYRAIEYCIEQGISWFEGGAQGEYKVRRGFEPVRTHSLHWIAHPGLGQAIGRHVEHERLLIDRYIADARDRLPYRTCPEPLVEGADGG